jgi:hypothetical protein
VGSEVDWLERRIVGIALGSGRIDGRPVDLGEWRASLEALDQILLVRTKWIAQSLQKPLHMLKKDFRVLSLCAMAGVQIHDQLSMFSCDAKRMSQARTNSPHLRR